MPTATRARPRVFSRNIRALQAMQKSGLSSKALPLSTVSRPSRIPRSTMALTPSCRARSDVGWFVNEDEADVATTNTTAKGRSVGMLGQKSEEPSDAPRFLRPPRSDSVLIQPIRYLERNDSSG
ncbi:hypothetical protein M752DRAFT_57647 [Aspergillus phoenicis ATCC 13157]|uniref:Uncharacterized protein n=1 Tax=Aspergillus phoenicis ATCC 13157 TaxID=1353007 RepID=A0A370PBB5_ASPPH|nr:hypothetical protein M752DRAFT_57647 [Aspergillus phoenicis ATCC 13157]